MRTSIAITFLVLCLTACSNTPKTQGLNYNAAQFAGIWVMANGPYKGWEYKAATEGENLIISTLNDTSCLRANEKAFFGKVVGNQIRGKAYVCISEGNQTITDMVVSIRDINTLIARINRQPGSDFPDIQFNRKR